MKKKIVSTLLAMAVCLTITACGTTSSGGTSGTGSDSSVSIQNLESVVSEITADASTYFSDGDYKDVTGEEPNATITLSGDSGTISDTTRGTSGENVTITSKGIYRISGTSKNVTITVKDEKESGNVYLVLDNVTMENDSLPCIVVENADKVIIQCVGENHLTFTGKDGSQDGAIYAKDDLTVNGSGTLDIQSAQHGIVCKKDLKVLQVTLNARTEGIGLQAQKTIRVSGANVQLDAGHDGIQVSGDSEESYFYLASGKLNIQAGYDGIDVGSENGDATISVILTQGTVDITAGGGSGTSKDSKTSQKGIKCDGDIKIGEVSLQISAADDAIHAAGNVYVTDGELELSSSDDGIHADNMLTISGGITSITKSYEGLEAMEILIAGGETNVVASDDGINAAGGSDTNSNETLPGRWGDHSDGTGTLTISGGKLYVNAQGDGLDSNGSLYVTGGLVIVEGPTDGGNGALDRGDGNGCVCQITGGTVLAIGSTGMAVNFDSGSQCSGLVELSGDAGTTITVDDGSDFTFTATKSFQCVVYSSSSMTQGNTYTVKAGNESATMDFSSSLYYSNVSTMGGGRVVLADLEAKAAPVKDDLVER